MLEEITYLAKAKNKAARYVLLGLGGTSMLFVLAAMLTPKYSGLVWLVAFGFIVASIYVYTKYVGAEYSYGIVEGVSRPSFTVVMRVGKTARTMARLDLDSIVEVKRMTREEYRAYKSEKGVVRYSYFPTMFAPEVYLVSVRSDYEKADVFIEIDDSFAESLLSYSAPGYDI